MLATNSKASAVKRTSAEVRTIRRPGTSLLPVLRTLVLLLAAFLSLYPILWMISSSFKAPNEVFTPTASLLPQTWVFTNYRDALRAWAVGDAQVMRQVIDLGVDGGMTVNFPDLLTAELLSRAENDGSGAGTA